MGVPAGKAFNSHLPEELHRVIKKEAATRAQKAGGQTNMNRIIVEVLFGTFKEQLSEEERQLVEKFIARL